MVNRNFNSVCKRGLDVVLSAVALIVAAPLMALISAAVWLDSPGPVIFVQERLGLEGRRFKMYKFRKFPPTWGDDGPAVTAKNDIRMTTVGDILERTKLDELPQFWNILKGDMSLVGPRPESPRYAALFKHKYAEVLEYLPGIFGPNQVRFRNECELYPPEEDLETFYRSVLFPTKAEIDLRYFQRATCLTDLILILKGMWVTIAGVVHWRVLLERDAWVVAVDIFLIAASWFFANLFRFSGVPGGPDLDIMIKGLIIIPVSLVLATAVAGCYRHPTQYFSLHDALRLVFALAISWLIVFLLLIGLYRNVSLYLAPMTGFILLTLLTAPRVRRRLKWQNSQADKQANSSSIVVYGAGRAGIAIANLIDKDNLVGFLDDDPNLKGKLVTGNLVLGSESDIPTIIIARPFSELWLTFLPTEAKLSRLKTLCDSQSVKLHVLPSIEPLCRFFEHSKVQIGSEAMGLNQPNSEGRRVFGAFN